METFVRNVRDLDQSDRSALERVVGSPLRETQQVIVKVVDPPGSDPTATHDSKRIPDWWKIYEGLSDDEIDRLDAAIRERTDLMHTFERADVSPSRA